MQQTVTYRNNGAIGALLDDYERSIKELKSVIQNITTNDLIYIVDPDTEDEDCKSIQTVLSHVVRSGYSYVIAIRKWLGEEIAYKNRELLNSISEYNTALDMMFAYNEKLFEDYPEIKLEEYNTNNKINVRWGQQYDVEQLLEHAIVHVLRHRRQIERFIIKLKH